MPEEFVVRPFAFMRLTHEAIRDGAARSVALAAELAAEPEPARAEALRTVFEQTRRGIAAHAAIEDAGFFPLLDEHFDQVCAQAGFRQQHTDEDQRLARIRAALDIVAAGGGTEEATALHRLVAHWAEELEKHLVHEEDVMMPLTQRVAPTAQGRAAAVHRIIDTGRDEVEAFLIPWVAERLEATKPFGPVRMFVGAVRMAHDAEERARIEPSLRSALSPEAVQKLESLGELG